MRLKLGLLGIGKIARDQHVPALMTSSQFELVACASRNASVDGVANFSDLETMLARAPQLDCVSICTPPQAHFAAALAALRAGKHVMLEKPPTATTRQIALLADEAARRGRTLFQTWHSRFAASVVVGTGAMVTVAVVAPGGGGRLPRPTMIWACGLVSLSATSNVAATSAAE